MEFVDKHAAQWEEKVLVWTSDDRKSTISCPSLQTKQAVLQAHAAAKAEAQKAMAEAVAELEVGKWVTQL